MSRSGRQFCPSQRKKKVLMDSKRTHSAGKWESLKGSNACKQSPEDDDFDSDMSGMEVAHALTSLTQRGRHVNNLGSCAQHGSHTCSDFTANVPVESSSSSSVGSVAIESCGWRFQIPERKPGLKGVSFLSFQHRLFFSSPVSIAWPGTDFGRNINS